jgi:hypothetical protein
MLVRNEIDRFFDLAMSEVFGTELEPEDKGGMFLDSRRHRNQYANYRCSTCPNGIETENSKTEKGTEATVRRPLFHAGIDVNPDRQFSVTHLP